MNKTKRGRPSKKTESKLFDPTSIKLISGNELNFNDSLF